MIMGASSRLWYGTFSFARSRHASSTTRPAICHFTGALANGAGAFRLYRAAEMCAASLARRGRLDPVVELLASESDLLGEQLRGGDC
jgi:hypothetical protein